MKKVPLKNYFILGIILVVSVFVVLYLNKLCTNVKQNNNNLLNVFIREITPQELENYMIENPYLIIYLDNENMQDNTFQKKFKKLLIKYDLQKEVVFVNINQFDEKEFNTFIKKYYDNDLNIEKKKSLIIVDNQKIVDIMIANNEKFDINLIKEFFKENGVY